MKQTGQNQRRVHGARRGAVGLIIGLLASLWLSACGAPTPAAESTGVGAMAQPTATLSLPSPTSSPRPAPTATPSPQPPTPTPTPTVIPTATVTPTATLNPLTIAGLAARAYGGGALQVDKTLQVTPAFTRTLISYPSDGLHIAGFMDTPAGPGPFPVVIVLHGFIEPENYVLTPYTAAYADALARAGYVVIHPNLRNFPPSDDGPDLFRTGLAIDVMNLIALVKQQAGQPGPLALAQPDALGLWGHSMGGGVALRVLTISPDVDAAVLASAVSGDDKANFDYLFRATHGAKGREEYTTPDEIVQQIAPIEHLARVRAPVSIHHGRQDPGIPVRTSEALCQHLRALEKPVECYFYPNEAHIFGRAGTELLMQRSIDFFDRYLRPAEKNPGF